MKQEDFNNLGPLDFRNMTKSELKDLVKEQAASANRRYQNIKGRRDTSKAATAKVARSGGRFSVKGKTTHKELWKEAVRIQEFNRQPESNVRGAVQAAEQIEGSFNDGKSVKQSVKEYTRQLKKEAEKAKGKKLSKKELTKVKQAGRKYEKELRQKINKSWKDFVKGDYELGDTGDDFKPPKGPDKSPIDGDDFVQMQMEYYTSKYQEERAASTDSSSPFENVNDQTDEDSPFI